MKVIVLFHLYVLTLLYRKRNGTRCLCRSEYRRSGSENGISNSDRASEYRRIDSDRESEHRRTAAALAIAAARRAARRPNFFFTKKKMQGW